MLIGNIARRASGFRNPEEGRVYSPCGISPSVKADALRHPPLVAEDPPPRAIVINSPSQDVAATVCAHYGKDGLRNFKASDGHRAMAIIEINNDT